MKIEHTRCAGLDIYKKTVVAAIIIEDDFGRLYKGVRTFGTMTAELLSLSDWLLSHEITHAVMESTGKYWKPVWKFSKIVSSCFWSMLSTSNMCQVERRM